MKRWLAFGILAVVITVVIGLRTALKENAAQPSSEPVLPNRKFAEGPADKDKDSVRVPFVGEVNYKKLETLFPTGDWLRDVDPFAGDLGYEKAEKLSQEELESWQKPSVYYDAEGRIITVSFSSDVAPTVSLDGMAEEKIRNDAGLAIVRHGYPPGVSADKLNADFLRGSLEFWRMGGESTGMDVSLTPVIVQVLSAGHELSGTRDGNLVGLEIPMILVKIGRQYTVADYMIATNSRMDDVAYGDRVRRTWTLIPYVRNEQNGELSLPVISGGAEFDEPKLDVWNKMQAEAGKNR